ncbi:methyltransferase domain-containing protein [Brucella anthropi]|uniref:methyltransferase domain-containing protein n=1 Tax=Brucella anthropi TaxID=529 RepID=UPI0006964DBC|nr:methyltransferase domain-containing protein [Brucella anthropi]
MTTELERLVSKLPEVYQPIWGRPDLSASRSRGCEDRLQQLLTVYSKVSNLLGRPLRVLDLGCAQGYFSHALSDAGAEVCGVDYLAENIAVCRAIAQERGDKRIVFKCDRVEEFVQSIAMDEYDLVLGLSVFHHMVEAKGITFVIDCLNVLARKSECCIFEFATNVEPVHWASAQPANVEDLLVGFSYIHLLAQHETHLSEYKRPLYFASSKVFYVDDVIFHYQKWTTVSNALVPNSREGRRRFYFSKDKMAKQYKILRDSSSQLEKNEWRNEVSFLTADIEVDYRPKIYSKGFRGEEAWIVREIYEGNTLDDFIVNGRYYDSINLLESVLKYLSQLEQAGYYHSDLRAWNTLICDDGSVRLIDYGAISRIRSDCSWPHDLFLSFLIFCHEVLGRKIEFPIPTRPSWLNPDDLPSPYNEIFWGLLKRVPDKWSFSDLYEQIKNAGGEASFTGADSIPGPTMKLMAERYEESAGELRRHLAWLEGKILNVEDVLRQKDAEILRFESTLEEIRTEHEKTIAEYEEVVAEHEKAIEGQNLAYKTLHAEKNDLEDRLSTIFASRSWKLVSRLSSIKRLILSK